MTDIAPDSFDLLEAAGKQRVHLISLGCPKNRVDSELMVGALNGSGCRMVDEPEDADVIVVNTCAFIDSAKEESIDTIVEMARFKELGSAQRLVVTGCMSQRYGKELAAEMPEVDVFLGTNEFKRIASAVSGELPQRSYITPGSALYTSDEARVNSIRGGSAYLKIAEGCNRTCSFCIIPKIRGKQVSRSRADLVREAALLGASGVKEISLIAQDLTSYGVDLGEKHGLESLLDELQTVNGIEWIRLHYAYPWGFTDRLLQIVKDSDRVLPYMDMPLQHISDRMLRSMRRAVRAKDQRALIAKLREVPEMVLRTTFIAGYPGESESEHEELCDWLDEVQFDHVGVFAYSREENTLAAELEGQLPVELAEARRDALMERQSGISRRRNEARIGSRLRVLVDGVSAEHEYVLEGRHYGQALDVDGVTYLSFEDGVPAALPGEMVTVEIEDATEYDLVGAVVGD